MADKYVFENEDSDDQKAEEEEQPPWLQETHGFKFSIQFLIFWLITMIFSRQLS